MKLGVWEQLAKQGVPRWQVHKRVAGGSQRRGAKRPVDVCPAPSLRRTQCTNFWVVYNCTLSKLRGFRLLPFQHAATGTEPVCPFLSGKLFQLVLQCLFIIDGFPQFLRFPSLLEGGICHKFFPAFQPCIRGNECFMGSDNKYLVF